MPRATKGGCCVFAGAGCWLGLCPAGAYGLDGTCVLWVWIVLIMDPGLTTREDHGMVECFSVKGFYTLFITKDWGGDKSYISS